MTETHISASSACDYLASYVRKYREEYERAVDRPPKGGGYPQLDISPFLSSTELHCFIGRGGYAIVDLSREPTYAWWIAGGPALMVDLEPSQTPAEVRRLIEDAGLVGQNIGIYRIVAKDGVPREVWEGRLGNAIDKAEARVHDTLLVVEQFDLEWAEIVSRLTFGAFGLVLDAHLPGPDSDFWTPHLVRNIGMMTADRKFRRFFRYLELSPHTSAAAWDSRSIRARVHMDVRRDFADVFTRGGEGGGTLSFGSRSFWPDRFHDRLSNLEHAISSLKELLASEPEGTEDLFHELLMRYPILLDVYGQVLSKPRFNYPSGESPTGKTYVEPDFVVKYPGGAYRLVEIERPNKALGTVRGQSRSEIAQAAFQIAEWRTFIQNHYDVLKADFPGIAANHKTTVIVSRSSAESVGEGRDPRRYLELVRNQFQVDDLLTYDDLLARSQEAYVRLTSLGAEE